MHQSTRSLRPAGARPWRPLAIATTALGLVLALPALARAQTFAVTPTADAPGTVIDGAGLGSRIFSLPGSQTVAIDDLTLAHGQAAEGGGGAILVESAGTIDLTRVTLEHDSTTADGGALRELDGAVHLTDVSFLADSARLGGALNAWTSRMVRGAWPAS